MGADAEVPTLVEATGLRKLWYIVVLTVSPTFLYGMFRFSLGLALPDIQATFGINNAGAGALATISLAATGAITLPAGALADKVGEKKVIVVGSVCYGLGLLLAMFSHVYLLFVVFLALNGLGSGLMTTPTYQLMGTIAPRTRGLSVSLVSGSYNIGGFTGLVIVGSLLALGWRIPFIITGGLAIALAVFQWVFLKHRYSGLNSHPPRMFRMPMTRNIWVLGVAMLLADFGFLAFATWTPDYIVKQLNLDKELAGFVFGFTTLAGLAGVVLAGHLGDRLGGKAIALVSGILSTVFSLLLYSLGVFSVTAFILFLATGFVTNSFWTVLSFLAQKAAKEGYVGTATGIVQQFGFVGAIMAPSVVGLLLDSSVPINTALIMTVTLPYALFTLAILAFKQRKSSSLATENVPKSTPIAAL